MLDGMNSGGAFWAELRREAVELAVLAEVLSNPPCCAEVGDG